MFYRPIGELLGLSYQGQPARDRRELMPVSMRAGWNRSQRQGIRRKLAGEEIRRPDRLVHLARLRDPDAGERCAIALHAFTAAGAAMRFDMRAVESYLFWPLSRFGRRFKAAKFLARPSG